MQQQDPAFLPLPYPAVCIPITTPPLPMSRRHRLWPTFLVMTSATFGLALACAAPMAAFCAATALTLPRRNALLLAGGIWFANQGVGYAVLDYPWTAESFAWGGGLGIVTLFSTVAAQWATLRLEDTVGGVVRITTFLTAFAAYEGSLFAINAALLGTTEDFVPTIIGQIFGINVIAFFGLLALHRLATATPAHRYP